MGCRDRGGPVVQNESGGEMGVIGRNLTHEKAGGVLGETGQTTLR